MEDFPAFESIADLKKSQVHYNHYNIFHILERKLLLHAKAQGTAAANGEEKLQDPDAESSELDKSTLAYKMYHSLALPPIPPRYHELNLPPHWFIDVVHTQKKRRAHRKSHGLIPFKELAQLVATNHKSCDYETKHWCQDVATMITAHNKAMQEEYTKLNKGKKQTEQKKPEVPQVSDESTRPQLSRMEAEFPSLQSSGRRLSHHEVEEQHQMLQSYKIALEREGLNHLDLANVMIAERERNMSTSFNTDRTMHGFNIMHNGAHTMSAPRPITSFANNWDSRSPNIMSLPLGPNDTRCFPTQGADRLPFSRGAAARNYDEPRPDDPMEDSRKPAAKTDEKMKINANESTSKPSPAFIRQLYEMISDSDTNDIIHWLPCGTIFNISDKKAFTRQLIPKFQDEIAGTSNNEKFKSFKLYLKQTGFERVTSDSHNGAYKKDGFVKIQSMPAATSLGTSLINQAFSNRQQQLEMFANANRQAQLMTQYQGHRSMYPHRSSLPGMSQDEIGMGQRISNDMVFGYFQGLAAARSYDMMNNRRFSMPISLNHSYTNGHARITSKDSDDKQTK